MTALLDRLMSMWLVPLSERDDPLADFRSVYADPVVVNGTPRTTGDMVARAGAIQAAYADLAVDIVDRIETADRIVVGFVMRGRHVGPLPTPLGAVPATGRRLETRVTDILTIAEDRVTDIWVVADDLATLRELGAVALTERGDAVEP